MFRVTTPTVVPWVFDVAMFEPVASNSAVPEPSVAPALEAPKAWIAASLVISASAFAPPPEIKPIVTTSDSAFAKLLPVASTRRLPAVEIVPSNVAFVPPAIVADGRFTATETAPPAPASS